MEHNVSILSLSGEKLVYLILILMLTRTPLGYSAKRVPLGGGTDSAPCLTPQPMVVERREKRQTKALNKTNLKNTKKITSRGQRSGQGQVKGQNYRFPHNWLPNPTGAALIGAIYPERVQRLVRRRVVLKTSCKGQSQGQVRSPKVIC